MLFTEKQRQKRHLFRVKNMTKSIYIHSIYIVYLQKCHFWHFILWVSYVYYMGILWFA